MPQNDQALLTRLKASGLEFVVVGGVCVVYHGAPLATFDLDICCPFGEENIRRIETAVADLHPVHRLTSNKLSLASTRSNFGEFKNLYLQTDLGNLDCIGEVSGVGTFEAVLRRSVEASFSYGTFRFLNLEALIASKRAAGRERDLIAVRQLLAIEERHKTRGRSSS
jgi:hypothetical protein